MGLQYYVSRCTSAFDVLVSATEMVVSYTRNWFGFNIVNLVNEATRSVLNFVVCRLIHVFVLAISVMIAMVLARRSLSLLLVRLVERRAMSSLELPAVVTRLRLH